MKKLICQCCTCTRKDRSLLYEKGICCVVFLKNEMTIVDTLTLALCTVRNFREIRKNRKKISNLFTTEFVEFPMERSYFLPEIRITIANWRYFNRNFRGLDWHRHHEHRQHYV